MKLALAATAGLAALLASASAPAQPDCLQIGRIYSWNAPDNRTLIVEDDLHRKFKVSLMSPCIGLQFKERVGFKSLGATQLSCLSPADDVIIHQMGGMGSLRCPIKSIVAYTAEMQKADAAAAAAKKASGNP